MDLGQIKILAEKARIPFKTVAYEIGMSEGNLHRCVRENKIQAADLEKIALLLNVDINVFFDKKLAALSNSVKTSGDYSPASVNGDVSVGVDAVLAERVKALETLVAEKERLIQVLMEARK